MNRLEQLIRTHCPEGVEYINLGDLAYLNGNGVDKKIIPGQKKTFLLNYMDVYRNKYIDSSVINMEVTASEITCQIFCKIATGPFCQ